MGADGAFEVADSHAQHPDRTIGSIPRPSPLIEAVAANSEDPALEALYDEAVRDTIEQFEATGSPVITDGEQRKYPQLLDLLRSGASQHRS